MPVVDTTNFANQSSDKDSVSKILSSLLAGEIRAFIVDESGKPMAGKDSIDDAIAEYSRSNGDTSVYNKWIQIDTTLDKALKKYLMEVENLLGTLTGQGQAKASFDQQPPVEPQPQTTPIAGIQQPGQSGLDKKLPTQESSKNSPMGPIGKALTKALTKDEFKKQDLKKNLMAIGASEEQANGLVRNQMYKKGEMYPDMNNTKPFTKGMVDEEAIIEEGINRGLSFEDIHEVLSEVKKGLV